MLKSPEQQLGELAGLPSRLALHAELQPWAAPVALNWPLKFSGPKIVVSRLGASSNACLTDSRYVNRTISDRASHVVCDTTENGQIYRK